MKTRNRNSIKQNTSNIMYLNIFGRNMHIGHIALVLFCIFAFGYLVKGTIETAYIAKNGIETKGVITDVFNIGSKGVEKYYYKFSYSGTVYSNSTIHLSKSIGDTVKVIFLKDNPAENKIEETLLNTYGFFLKRNPNLK